MTSLGALDHNWIDGWNVIEFLRRCPEQRLEREFWMQESKTVQLARKSDDTKADRDVWALPVRGNRHAFEKISNLMKDDNGGTLVIEGPPEVTGPIAGRAVHMIRCVLLPTAYGSAWHEDPMRGFAPSKAPALVMHGMGPPLIKSILALRARALKGAPAINILTTEEPVPLVGIPHVAVKVRPTKNRKD